MLKNSTKGVLKQMKTCLATLLAASAAFAPKHALSAQIYALSTQINLVQNGSFEVLNYPFSGWTLTGGGLSLGGQESGIQCADGFNAVGLGSSSTLYQDVPTAVGQQYDFSFYMAAWDPSIGVPPWTVSLKPSFGATSLGTVSFNGAGHYSQDMGWQKFDYTVTATSTSSRISLFNPGPDWPMIDNVSLTSIPEPTANALLVLTGTLALSRCRRTRALQRTRR